jgi:uncharacterized protein YprB with RNaseH-like and TPR domain
VLFGIERTAKVVDGAYAPRLWHKYEMYNDEEALAELMAYNREDCTNLEILESLLDGLED